MTHAAAKSYTGFELAEAITQQTIAADGSTIVTIKYNRRSYDVIYNDNYSSLSSPRTAMYYGVPQNLDTDLFTRTGYTFDGWATSSAKANSGIIDYSDGDSFTIGEQNVTLYAVWTPNEIEITIDVPDSDGIGISYEIEPDTTDPTKENIVFCAIYPDNSYVDSSDGYTFKWFYTNQGIDNPESTNSSWIIPKDSLQTGILYQISLIAIHTASGVPSGGTVQIKVE